jgi:3-oxoadipate enol-lactonase
MPFATTGGVRLHYEDGGEGRPLLLIAGIPAIVSDWLPVANALRTTRRVIAYDNRGSGESDTPVGPYTTAELAEDAAALLDALGAVPADVFGISMGGMIAQELALRHPGSVRRLVLGCTHAATRTAVRPPKEASRAFAAEVGWAERMLLLSPFAFTEDVDAGLLERFIEKKSGDVQSEEGYRAQIAAVLAHDASARLGDIGHETLVITGDDDRVIPGANSELLASEIPNARLVVSRRPGTSSSSSDLRRRWRSCAPSSTDRSSRRTSRTAGTRSAR